MEWAGDGALQNVHFAWGGPSRWSRNVSVLLLDPTIFSFLKVDRARARQEPHGAQGGHYVVRPQ
eukprot:8073155-Pyramimonas_sp.AAC.1